MKQPPKSNLSSPDRTMRIDLLPRERARTATEPAAPVPATGFASCRVARANRNTPYEKLLESVYDAVLITDRRGMIRDFNTRALEFFLSDESAMPDRSVLTLISGADQGLLDKIEHNLAAYKYTVVEAYCVRGDGTTFPSEIAITRIDLEREGQICFFVRDITERTRAQQDLRNAVERLEALDRARLEFVSNVSHELRTPLTSMIYAVKNMQRGVAGPLPEKAMQYLERLNADCRRLQGTVNDILDLRQIENKTLTLARSRIPLARLVEIGVESLRVQAEEKHIQMLICKPAQSGFVLGDPHKMERVILNVVGNAIKFTPEGGSIAVTIESVSGDNPQVVVRVSDTGIGIPSEAIDRIAVRYFKVGDQPTGSGLGLAISREIIELHGGVLQIESPVPGTSKGTRVSMGLPMVTAPRVLVVAEDDALMEQLVGLCTAQGYPAAGLGEAGDLLPACHRELPDVVIVSRPLVEPPVMDLVMRIRNDRRTSRLPIILVADDSLKRAELDMLISLQIPLIAMPLKDQALVAALNIIFYDRTLITDRTSATAGPRTVTISG